jgi:hypothetical protein
MLTKAKSFMTHIPHELCAEKWKKSSISKYYHYIENDQ